MGPWTEDLYEPAADIFDAKRAPKPADPSASLERLYSEIGRLKMEVDWLKKVWARPVAAWTGWVSPHEPLPLTRHCALTVVTRSTRSVPHPAATLDEQEWTLRGLIDVEYIRHQFYGSRTIR